MRFLTPLPALLVIASPAAPAALASSGTQATLATEWLHAPDARLREAVLQGEWSPPGRQYVLSAKSGRVDLDYGPAPTDILSEEVNRRENRTAAELTARFRTAASLSPFVSVGGYRGFTDFRSVWLDEYYRQLFTGVPGYAQASPRGWHALAGARWAYLPGSAFLQGTAVFQNDHVSPGYEPQIRRPLLRGRERLTTRGARISLEAVLSPTVRASLEAGGVSTTGRRARWSAQGSLNWSVAPVWTARAVVAGVTERPAFHAESASLGLEHDWDNRWFVGLFVRGYRDSGEVVDPAIVSTAAPNQRTRHFAASLRWQGERLAVRFEGGPYRTRYDAVPPLSAHFSRLYRDRNWRRAQGTVSWSF